MKIEVYYMSGAGNLFSVIDNRKYNFSNEQGEKLAKILCNVNEYNDFNSEGLMFLEEGNIEFDFICKFFNPDGSTGMMCGNGGRAITRFAEVNNMIKNKDNVNFYMSGDKYKSEFNGNNIKLYMPPPILLPNLKSIKIANNEINGYFSNTGTYHYVVNCEENNINFENFDINELGSQIRNHKDFIPNGTNVNFIDLNSNIINLRTYEKGVEAETGACGTGAVATALTVNQFYNVDFPVKIIPTSKEELIIHKIDAENVIRNMILEGPAKILYSSIIHLPNEEFLI